MRTLALFLAIATLTACGSDRPEPECHYHKVKAMGACGWDWRMGCQSCVLTWDDNAVSTECLPPSGVQEVCR